MLTPQEVQLERRVVSSWSLWRVLPERDDNGRNPSDTGEPCHPSRREDQYPRWCRPCAMGSQMAHAPASVNDRQGSRCQQDASQRHDEWLLRLEAGAQRNKCVDQNCKPCAAPRQRRALRLKPGIGLDYCNHSTTAMIPATIAAERARSGMAMGFGSGRPCRIAISFAFQRR